MRRPRGTWSSETVAQDSLRAWLSSSLRSAFIQISPAFTASACVAGAPGESADTARRYTPRTSARTSARKTFADPQTHRFHYEEIATERGIGQLNPVCKELYLDDKEFHTVFGMDKDAFWKQPAWKQRDAKKKKGLF